MKHYTNIMLVAIIFILAIAAISLLFQEPQEELTDSQRQLQELRDYERNAMDHLNYDSALALKDSNYCNFIQDTKLQRDCFRNFN